MLYTHKKKKKKKKKNRIICISKRWGQTGYEEDQNSINPEVSKHKSDLEKLEFKNDFKKWFKKYAQSAMGKSFSKFCKNENIESHLIRYINQN